MLPSRCAASLLLLLLATYARGICQDDARQHTVDSGGAGLEAAVRSRPSQDGPREYTVDPSASHIYVVTHRSGLLSFLGHEHAIIPTDWTATLCFDEAAAEASSAAFTVNTRSLVIDSAPARALAGLGGGPGEEDVREIQGKMLDEAHLAAETHPQLLFETTSVQHAGPGLLTVRGRLTIRGVTSEVQLPVRMESSGPETIHLSGTLRVRQSAFGIRPESVAGVVKVADPVDIHFALRGTASGRICPAIRR
ncbi:MAG: YceI family protein [Gemmatimonadetes bacterium]|nr:YceI family protein [Gemmatimonadota bacterium]